MDFINLIDVEKSFSVGKRKISVLKKVNCIIKHGDFVVLLGASGSGKTTLLNLIAGLDKPDSGSIIVNDAEVSILKTDELSHWRGKNIGFIFQNYNLMPFMSALDNVALPLIFQRICRKERKKRSAGMLRAVGLKDFIDNACHLLSGGEQQRVTIARALVNNPEILIADEPTGDLDSKNAKDIMEIIYGLYKERKTTIIMATHNTAYTKYADQIINISDGKVTSQFRT